MQVRKFRAGTIDRWRWPSLVVVAAMLLAMVPVFAHPERVAAAPVIRFPFASGATWYVSQGYNTSPAEGWSHYNCDPSTLKDAISQTESCNAPYQYKYSFDLKRLDGNSTGQTVLSPVTGTIRWTDEAFGGMSIDLGNGYAVAYFHTTLAAGLAAGQTVTQGQVLGTVAPAGEAGNGGTAHIHLTLWSTTDGGNWSRNAVPFTGANTVDGYDFPAKSDATRNQYYQTQVISTNQPLAGQSATTPPVPSLVGPATGTTYTTSGVTPTLKWNAASGATEYQVVINDGAMTSPWVSTTSWTTPSLSNGQYMWQVRARNSAGTSALSAKWVFWVDPPSGSTPTPTPSATPAGTPGSLGLTLDRTTANFGTTIQATGSGFNANETVNIYLDSISTTAVKTTSANGSGNVSTSFSMPDTTNGNHTFIARGVTSKKQATDTIKMNATIARDPYQGPPGTSIDVTVHGFGGNESVAVKFDSANGALLGTITTGATGTGTVTITMPQATNGWHDYLGTGATSKATAYGALYVERMVKLSPTTGAPGDSVSLTARGLDGNTNVTVGWNRSSTVSGSTVCTGTTSANGNFSCSFTVPQTVAGGYPVTVTEADGSDESATFVVTGPAGIATNPGSGAVMTNFIVNGGGFTANEQIRLSWDSASSAWVTIQADEFGSFVWHATVPSLSKTAHTLKAKGLTSNKTASTGFTVTASGGDTGSSMIALGTYAVTATVEGLVGGTTSNGHVITDFDHFVSLPACTATSCPYAVGTSRYYADCGDNCYVRVTNPDTGLCSVAPVYDVGPWFTNDNWWDPAGERNLNDGGAAPNQLAQGYVGTDAALNGLDVGYGVSNGIGVSNVGYEVGNRAAIDIADGTWVDIGFDLAAGIGEVQVTLLWQTGETFASAARGCGQSTGTPAVTLDPPSGKAGATVTVSGSDFQANETVNIYLDSSKTTPIGTVKASGSGRFSTDVTIPSGTAAGDHRIHAVGQSSKLRAAATYTVTVLAVSLSPSKGTAGSQVQVTGTGFGAGETVKLYLDSSKTAAIGSARTNNAGGFTATVTVAAGTTVGDHRIHAVGQTSKLRSAATYTVQPAVLSLNLAPGSAQIGASVQVTGSGFQGGETVKIYLDSSKTPAIGSTTADNAGTISATITVPATVGGSHRIHAVGQTSKSRTAQSLYVVPTISLSATSGGARANLTVSVKGFAANESLGFVWDGASAASAAAATTTDTSGVASFTVTAPWTIGDHTLLVSGNTSLLSGTATYTVTPKLRLTPNSGNSAAAFEVRGTGFPTATQVNVYWGSANASNLLCSVRTSSTYGTFTCEGVTPPAGASTGAVSILAIGGGQSASATFTVTALAAKQTSRDEPSATPTPEATTPAADGNGATPEASATPAPADDATATPSEEPTQTPTEEPTEVPTDVPTETPMPEPTPRVIVERAAANTSVSAAAPERPRSGETAGALAIGGDPESVTLITFQVDGIAAGTVVQATLVLTGAGDGSGAGGQVGVIVGYALDSGTLTYASVPFDAVSPAADASGGVATVAWLDPGVETAIDVTGTVTADGMITFVLRGDAAAAAAIAGRGSGAPPRLELTVIDPA